MVVGRHEPGEHQAGHRLQTSLRATAKQSRAAGRSIGRDCFAAQALLAMTAPTWSEICPSQSKTGSMTVRVCFLGLILDDPGPQEARLAVGVVCDTAGAVEDHRRAVRIRVGGPSRDGGIVWAAVAGEGDPG